MISVTEHRDRKLVNLALRCTPTPHSDDVHLDALSLSALEEDLGLDLIKERASMKDSDDRFRIEGQSGARRIAELANNSPSHWEPRQAFSNSRIELCRLEPDLARQYFRD